MRAPALPWLASIVALASCCTASPPPRPNGAEKQLVYNTEFPRQATGLWQTYELLQSISRGGGKLDPTPRQSLAFDFEGTRLEAQGEGEAEVLDTRQEPAKYTLRVACTKAPAPGVASGVRVRILAGEQVRYRDFLPVTCVPPTALAFTPVALSETFARYVVGSTFPMAFRLEGAQGGKIVPLQGHGFRAESDAVSVSEEGANHLVIRAERPGRRPRIAAGPLSAELPVDIVPASAIRTIELAPEVPLEVNTMSPIVGKVLDADGERLGGVPCRFWAEGLTDFMLNPIPSRSCAAGFLPRKPGSGRICAEVAGKRSCLKVTLAPAAPR